MGYSYTCRMYCRVYSYAFIMYCGDTVTHVVCIVGIQLYVVCNVGDTVICSM